MKKVLMFLTIVLIAINSFSQTNLFPDNGGVGIGTINPLKKLDVKIPYSMNHDEELRIGFYPNDDANKYYGFGLNFKVDGNGYPTKHIVNYHNGAKYYSMTFKEGNVGISRTNPIAKVDVGVPYAMNKDEEIRIGYYPNEDANRYYGFGLNFKVDGNGYPTKHIVNYHNGVKYYSMTFKEGFVGIKTTNPQYELDVLGTIRAREIKVDLSGADFVFEDTYNLMALEEVESFIKENKHLPEIEPAIQMKANGVELGELNTKLIQKIEELTIYIIEMNKTINSLVEESTELKEKIGILESE